MDFYKKELELGGRRTPRDVFTKREKTP